MKRSSLPDGKVINGAFAAKATVQAPSGRVSRYSGFLGLGAGTGKFALPIGANDEVGKWTLLFEGGLPRKSVRAELEVTKGKGVGSILSARPARKAK